jgi:hypothetical protein
MAINVIDNSKIYDPSTGKQLIGGAYKNAYSFADQYFPHLKKELVNIWGDQSLLGYLDYSAKEELLNADQSKWSEDNRRRKMHIGVARTANVFTSTAHSLRVGDYIMVSDITGDKKEKGIVTAVADADTFTAKYEAALAWTVATTALRVWAIGSEFKKGTEGRAEALITTPSIYSTSPVIKKDMYEINGGDIPNVSWIESPAGNEYWYFRDEMESMFRFMDSNEMQLLDQDVYDAASDLVITDGLKGSQGLFAAIKDRGNSFQGFIDGKDDMDAIVERLDKVNGQRFNQLYVSTEHSFAIDDTLGGLNQFDTDGYNFGIYGNEETQQMIMNLGFQGFRRGSYEFHKQGWKVLTDATMYNPDNFGASVKNNGIMMPLGQTTIKNEIEGNTPSNVDFLTILYKGKTGYSRKLVTTFHGSQMTPYAESTKDVYGVDWLSESCLRPVGMIRWMIFEG